MANEISATRPDFSRKATQVEMVQCLTLLSVRPSRTLENSTISHAAYFIALDGVGSWALQEAAKQILRGSLGHPFFPEPSELRTQCEKAMEPIRDQWARERREREIAEATAEGRRARNRRRSPEEIERHQRLMARFNENFVPDAERKLLAEREEIRARYGMTDEVMDKITDRPPEGTPLGEIKWKR